MDTFRVHVPPPAPQIAFTYLNNVFAGTVQVEGRHWGAVKRAYRK